MHMLQSLFYLTTALNVSGFTITHLHEHKTTVTTASGNRYTVLLSAVIVEESNPSESCTSKDATRKILPDATQCILQTHCLCGNAE